MVINKLEPQGQALPVADERAAFERHWRNTHTAMNVRRRDDGQYAMIDIEDAWRAWQARAALSQPAEEGDKA